MRKFARLICGGKGLRVLELPGVVPQSFEAVGKVKVHRRSHDPGGLVVEEE